MRCCIVVSMSCGALCLCRRLTHTWKQEHLLRLSLSSVASCRSVNCLLLFASQPTCLHVFCCTSVHVKHHTWVWMWNMDMHVKHGYECETWTCMWNMGMNVKHGYSCETWVCMWNVGMHVKHGYACETWICVCVKHGYWQGIRQKRYWHSK